MGVDNDESFKVRVDRVFGSLMGAAGNAPSPSPWTLSDAEVERKHCLRQTSNSDSLSSSFDDRAFFSGDNGGGDARNALKAPGEDVREDDFDDLNDDGDEDVRNGRCNRDDEPDFENEIRDSIGKDCTLDNEEEEDEDEYDKVAVGRENAGDRMFMSDVSDYGSYVNCYNELPDSIEEVKMAGRDPRANHLAARARLQEDKEAAGSFNSSGARASKMPGIVDSQAKATADGGNVRSILKRKDNQVDSKSKKRVRFDSGSKDDKDRQSEEVHTFSMVSQSMETSAADAELSKLLPDNVSRVPDYIRNPSNYVCYTFDSTNEDDEESNMRAFQDFRKTVANMSASAQLERAASPPKSVTFIPRKKASDAAAMNEGLEAKPRNEDVGMVSSQMMVLPVGLAAGDDQVSEVCAMDEDYLETSRVGKRMGFRGSDRQYRSKASADD